MLSQREPSDYALAMIASILDHPGSRPEPTDYALATTAMILDHPVSHTEPEKVLVEEQFDRLT
jgi:hypothetical protein